MVGIVLDVDPRDFLSSSSRAGAASRALASAGATLRLGLAGASRIAGSDPTGLRWAAQYDEVAIDAVAGLDSLANAVDQIAAGLSATGLNYATADWLSAGKSGHAAGYAVPSPPAPACSAPPLSAAGGSRASDIPGWEYVADLIGDMWPDGDTGKLRHAQSVWSSFADRLDTIHGRDVPRILTALEGTKTTELPTIHSTVATVKTGVTNLATESRTLTKAAGDLADQIDEVHQQTENALRQLVDQLAATTLIGVGLTIVTAGASDVVAGVADAAEVTTVAARILNWIAELGASVGRAIDGLADSAAAVDRVAKISDSLTIRVVTIAGRSVVTGAGGAAMNVGATTLADPAADLNDAAVQGFVAGAAFGGLGSAARLAGAATADRVINGVFAPGTTKFVPAGRFAASYARSVHNAEEGRVMLGKYDGGGPTSYIRRAGDSHTYFDMGDEFGRIERRYRLDDGNMFDLYNATFLDDAIAQNKVFHFSHDPRRYPNSALGSEFRYLGAHGYKFDEATMTATRRANQHDE